MGALESVGLLLDLAYGATGPSPINVCRANLGPSGDLGLKVLSSEYS